MILNKLSNLEKVIVMVIKPVPVDVQNENERLNKLNSTV